KLEGARGVESGAGLARERLLVHGAAARALDAELHRVVTEAAFIEDMHLHRGRTAGIRRTFLGFGEDANRAVHVFHRLEEGGLGAAHAVEQAGETKALVDAVLQEVAGNLRVRERRLDLP